MRWQEIFVCFTVHCVAALLILFTVPPANAADPDPLFAADDLLEITLEGPFKQLNKTRDNSVIYSPANLTYTEPGGETRTIKVSISSRGYKRLKRTTCRFPPIRLYLEKENTAEVIFGTAPG